MAFRSDRRLPKNRPTAERVSRHSSVIAPSVIASSVIASSLAIRTSLPQSLSYFYVFLIIT